MSKQPWYNRVPLVSNVVGLANGDPIHALDPSGVGLLQDTTDALKKPYDAAAAANKKAGAEMAQLGADAQAQEQAGIGRALEQTTPAARFWHSTYEGEGGLAGPGALEKRYEEVHSGNDPALKFQMAEGNKSLSDAFAAKGGLNSGAADRSRALMNAKLISDSQTRIDNLAAGAQGAAETRMGGAFDRLSNLGQSRAGTVERGTQAGVNSYVAGRMGQINANLGGAQQGINFTKDMFNTGGQIGGTLVDALTKNRTAPPALPTQKKPGVVAPWDTTTLQPTMF
jgi:hypothetical protein